METKPSDTSPETLPTEPRAPFNELSILFPLLSIYTVAYLGLMAAEFFLGVVKAPAGMMTVYIALLGAYAADKEIRRWVGTAEPPRRGTVFVYLWMLFFAVAWVLHAFRLAFELPNELILVVLQVLGIFFGSRASKYVYAINRKEDPVVVKQRQAEILEMIKAAGKVTNRDVAARFQVSGSSANRLLAEMTAKGLIRQVGERKGTYYLNIALKSAIFTFGRASRVYGRKPSHPPDSL